MMEWLLIFVFLLSLIGYVFASHKARHYESILSGFDVPFVPSVVQKVDRHRHAQDRAERSIRLYQLWRKNLSLENHRLFIFDSACRIYGVDPLKDSYELDWIHSCFLSVDSGVNSDEALARIVDVPLSEQSNKELKSLYFRKLASDDQRMAIFSEACDLYGIDEDSHDGESRLVEECFLHCDRSITPGMVQIKLDELRRDWSIQ